jgi:MFS family permease
MGNASTTAPASALAPFRVRSFRFQWPADLATSWALEMEALILGWYILVETGSVLMLTWYASLRFIGTLLAPIFGVAGHRIGAKRLLCLMRATYTALAAAMMALALAGVLTPLYVFVLAGFMGAMSPSDLVMRYALIGETIPARQLMGATSVSRTTQDSARIAGALTGAGLVAALGIGAAYAVVTALYACSFLLTTQVGGPRRAAPPVPGEASSWRDLKEGAAYVWNTPQLVAAMWLALLVNLTAFPLVNALLPYVAKEIYLTDQTGLGYVVASFAGGALVGSIALSRFGHLVRAGRMMIVFCVVWYALILLFAQMDTLAAGIAVIATTGCAQSISMISMSAMLLRNSADAVRGRVMGIRQMAVYGMPVGLLIAGPLVQRHGYPLTATFYCSIGLAITFCIAWRWRAHLWLRDAAANRT